MEDGTDKGISDGKEVDIKRFEYHDENGADIHATGVTYNAGEINVYVAAEPQGDKVEWNISKDFYNAGEEEAEVTVTQVNGKTTDGVSGALMIPEVTRKILSLPDGYDWDSAFVTGDAYLNLSKVQTNTKEYDTTGRLGFIITGEGNDTPSGDTIALLM